MPRPARGAGAGRGRRRARRGRPRRGPRAPRLPVRPCDQGPDQGRPEARRARHGGRLVRGEARASRRDRPGGRRAGRAHARAQSRRARGADPRGRLRRRALPRHARAHDRGRRGGVAQPRVRRGRRGRGRPDRASRRRAASGARRDPPGALHHPPSPGRGARHEPLPDREVGRGRHRPHHGGGDRGRGRRGGAGADAGGREVRPRRSQARRGAAGGRVSGRFDPSASRPGRLDIPESPVPQSRPETRFVFVTGGVVSALGKGIAAASLGQLLVARGLSVTIQKFDPYINVDPGTMSPFQHGEVFVTEDGAETDLDLGHYERFTDVNTSRASNATAGAIYNSVIRRVAESADVDMVITEIGGTVGDIESLPFLEALRQFHSDLGRDRCMFVHLTLVPFLGHAGELKTKPTQHSVQELRRIGIQPDMVMCRSEEPLGKDIREKIALFANLPVQSVVSARDVDSIYKVPLEFEQEGVADRVLDHFRMGTSPPDLSDWKGLVERIGSASEPVRIALVGKYNQLADAYLSVIEALNHAGTHHGGRVEVHWVDSERLTDGEVEAELATCDGILVPGGFGVRGIEGKIKAARFARENGVPYLGICLGMQIAVSEFARHVADMDGANSTEFDPETPYPVIDLLPEQKEVRDMGGTMRLGADPVKLHEGTRAREVYGEAVIYERHRHRYEVNNFLRKRLEHAGLTCSGPSPDDRLVGGVELRDHPFFVASQFHPQVKSRPLRPQPLFREFVRAALERASAGAPEVEPEVRSTSS